MFIIIIIIIIIIILLYVCVYIQTVETDSLLNVLGLPEFATDTGPLYRKSAILTVPKG